MAEADSNRQKIMLGVLLLGLLGYVGYTYAYQPRAQRLGELESRLEALEFQNRVARQLTEDRGRDRVERQLAEHREQLARVEGLIPSSEELPDLLDAISAEAQRTGVELALIQPSEASAEAFYTRRTYDLGVLGPYHQIAEFLTRIGSLPRIITPINLNVTVKNEGSAGEEPQLEARFSIETYVLPLAPAADTANAS